MSDLKDGFWEVKEILNCEVHSRCSKCGRMFRREDPIIEIRVDWTCGECSPQPQYGPITPSPMIDPEVMAEYRRSVEQFGGRKDVPR